MTIRMTFAEQMAGEFGSSARVEALGHREDPYWCQAHLHPDLAYRDARLAAHFGRIALSDESAYEFSWKCLCCGGPMRAAEMTREFGAFGCPRCLR